MASQIHVLALVPYEGMKHLLLCVAEEFPQMELEILVANMEQGAEIARNARCQYDVILSRGGTAKFLRQLALPVVEIEFTPDDLLCAMKLADGVEGPVALVSVAEQDFAESARLLCSLVNSPLEIRTVSDTAELEGTLRELKSSGCGTVLCDVGASVVAKQLGMNAILITSGRNSLRRALRSACAFCQERERLAQNNLFLREILRGQAEQVVVFDQTGALAFATQEELSPELMKLLRQELQEPSAAEERHSIHTLDRLSYSFTIRHFSVGEDDYTAIYFLTHKLPHAPSQAGIQICSRQEAEQSFYNSIFSLPLIRASMQEKLQRFTALSAPIMISGEHGTGRDEAAMQLYIRGLYCNSSMINIHCGLLSEKSLDFLLESPESPLLGEKHTIYFSQIDGMSAAAQQRMLAALLDMEVCQRNWVIFSCLSVRGSRMSPAGVAFMDKLKCQPLFLPPLREMADTIPTLVSLFLSQINMELQTPVLGADPAAVSCLQDFSWPQNYVQFHRVISQLAAGAGSQIITPEAAEKVIAVEEEEGAASAAQISGRALEEAGIDLSQTLSDIDRQVAFRVLRETGGNQTAAARRLGISRTTFWRLVKEKNEQ